jgi:hypothetical protein
MLQAMKLALSVSIEVEVWTTIIRPIEDNVLCFYAEYGEH